MKFLSVRDLKTKSSQIWQELTDQKEMVITSNGRPIAILSSTNENNLEQVLSAFRHARVLNATLNCQQLFDYSDQMESFSDYFDYGRFSSPSLMLY